jgi:maleylacetate reductase
MRSFIYTSQPQRIVFGEGSLARVCDEAERLGATRCLVLCTPNQREQAEQVSNLLGPASAGVFDGAVMHVPIGAAREARVLATRLRADCAVAVGGGSTIGLGKAIALESGLPIIAVPTTYAGSEVTPIYGITQDGLKTTGRDQRVLPRTVIYDPELTYGLPVPLSVTSGINAIAHAAEGLYAQDRNPVMDAMACEGIAALGRAILKLSRVPGVSAAELRAARSDALYGAWLCGSVLGNVSVALHHKLCHTLGGSFGLPHAETHTAVLPHALAYNASCAPAAMRRIAAALGAADAAQGVFDLARDAGAATSLRELGMKESDLDRACELALAKPYPNPRPLEKAALRQLLQDAFEGTRPAQTMEELSCAT